jgi:molybdopterin converting factor small subunit
MATYYKYAERSADSQINWAEVGKNMSDMLKEETRIREEKKAAIDAASREFGQTLANPPQGEHKGANQWALEYADNASKFMLMQDRLLKSGQMKLKDYTVARQNILDGTDQAFNLTKEYQANFAEKMERYKTDKSQDLEQWLMAQAEGYSDFNKSQLYINPTDGTLSVAMKEKKIVDGKEVFVMNQNPNQFASVSTLRNQIAGKYDKFNTNSATDAFVNSLGEEVTSVIKQGASLTSGGLILNVEDIRKRTDLSEDGKQILYKFADSENQFIKSTLVNPFDRLSVLTNSKKFAPNGQQYGFTYDEAEAKGNPAKILLRRDPSSGQPTPQFTNEQMKVSEDFLRTELRAKYSRKEELKPTPQAQLQERRAPTGGEIEERNRIADAKNFAENMATALTGKDPVAIKNAISYLANKSGKKVDRTATGLIIKNSDGTNESTYNFLENGRITDPKKLTKAMVSAFGTGLPEDKIVQFANQFIGGNQLETKTSASGFKEVKKPAVVDPMTVYGKHIDAVITDADVSGLSKGEAADALNAKLSGLGVKVKSSLKFNDDIYVVNDDNKESPLFDVKKAGTVEAIKKWIKANPSGGTPVQKAANIKALVKSGVIKSGTGELDD